MIDPHIAAKIAFFDALCKVIIPAFTVAGLCMIACIALDRWKK